jgi:glycerol-3-phosphate dehydrogenase
MATRRSALRRILKPVLYTAGAAGTGAGILYFTYRPRNIPGSEAAAVPPPIYGEGGQFQLPAFPAVKSREEQIADLKRSFAGNRGPGGIRDSIQSNIPWLWGGTRGGGGGGRKDFFVDETTEEEEYDLLIIGAGATGAGIALDAATRGLRVAVVERDDFSSGTSSKSTKLVHGGVRYLEKAVWELDYSQYVE